MSELRDRVDGMVTNNVNKQIDGIVGSGIKSALLKDTKKGESIGNLFTGKRVRPMVGVGIAALGVAGALSKMSTAPKSFDTGNDIDALNHVDNMTLSSRTKPTAPGASARGVAPSILAGGQNTGSADNMGATGDMVFGMHNKRHG